MIKLSKNTEELLELLSISEAAINTASCYAYDSAGLSAAMIEHFKKLGTKAYHYNEKKKAPLDFDVMYINPSAKSAAYGYLNRHNNTLYRFDLTKFMQDNAEIRLSQEISYAIEDNEFMIIRKNNGYKYTKIAMGTAGINIPMDLYDMLTSLVLAYGDTQNEDMGLNKLDYYISNEAKIIDPNPFYISDQDCMLYDANYIKYGEYLSKYMKDKWKMSLATTNIIYKGLHSLLYDRYIDPDMTEVYERDIITITVTVLLDVYIFRLAGANGYNKKDIYQTFDSSKCNIPICNLPSYKHTISLNITFQNSEVDSNRTVIIDLDKNRYILDSFGECKRYLYYLYKAAKNKYESLSSLNYNYKLDGYNKEKGEKDHPKDNSNNNQIEYNPIFDSDIFGSRSSYSNISYNPKPTYDIISIPDTSIGALTAAFEQINTKYTDIGANILSNREIINSICEKISDLRCATSVDEEDIDNIIITISIEKNCITIYRNENNEICINFSNSKAWRIGGDEYKVIIGIVEGCCCIVMNTNIAINMGEVIENLVHAFKFNLYQLTNKGEK